jgi:hypothetical protein
VAPIKRRYINCVKDDKKVAKKDDKKVAKKDDKKVAKKDSPLLPCLIVYSLKQKRERVAHCLSVFIIEIIYFDNFFYSQWSFLGQNSK